MRELKCYDAICEATAICMERDQNVYVLGLGATDPKGIFATTANLEQQFGSKRVFDMPISENGMTGIAIGSAIAGKRPVMTHQRLDFFLLALDQLINNAAKWHFMFDGEMSVPMVIRLIIGRGWGQGPQHSQSLHSLFAHIPGLKVVAPAFAQDAKGMLISAIEDPNPVVFIEHRWLHNHVGDVPEGHYCTPLDKAHIVREGSDITLVASSLMTIDALKAAKTLEEDGIDVEIVDLRSLRPLDDAAILASVRKTGRLIVLDGDWKTMSLASEVIAIATENAFHSLKKPPVRITYPDTYVPTSWKLANAYYPSYIDIIRAAREMMGMKKSLQDLLDERMKQPLDVPDKAFTGPF